MFASHTKLLSSRCNVLAVAALFRRVFDRIFGKDMFHTLVYRMPDVLSLRAEHFVSELTSCQRKDLFRQSVRFIEVESQSYCNRICWFCPNALVDRRSTRHYLDPAIYTRLLKDLRSVNFRHRFSFSRYNEPFADEVIFDRIAEARSALPGAYLEIFSNGDYLDPARLERARILGVDELLVGIYLPNEATWTEVVAERFLERAIGRFQLSAGARQEIPGERIEYRFRLRRMRIRVFCPNYARYGSTRGGTIHGVPISLEPRRSPCLYPVTDVYVDYNGAVMPCCHLRSDVTEHEGCSFGRLTTSPGSVFDVWTSESAARWRRALSHYAPKEGPCRTCRERRFANGTVPETFFKIGLSLAKNRHSA